jgi:lipopolysaccharide transport system ATP-binding protein
MEGAPEAVMDFYNAMLADKENKNVKQVVVSDDKVQTVSGSGEVFLESVELLNVHDKPVEVINIGEPLTIRIQYKSHQAMAGLTIGFMIKDRLGQPVFGTNTHHLRHTTKRLQTFESTVCSFRFAANFGAGNYSVAVALHSGDNHVVKNYEWRDLAAVFSVVNLDKPESVGVCWVPVEVAERMC